MSATHSQPPAAGEAAHTLTRVTENSFDLKHNGTPLLTICPAEFADDFTPEAQQFLAELPATLNSHAALVMACAAVSTWLSAPNGSAYTIAEIREKVDAALNAAKGVQS